MNGLLVVLSACLAAAVANPLVIKSPDGKKAAFPITSSEYLNYVLGRSPGMVAMYKPNVAEQDVVSLLRSLDLKEAANMAEQIQLNNILADSEIKSFTLFAPNDKAVESWKEQLREPIEDKESLARLFKAWIIPHSILRSSDIAIDEKSIRSMNGAKLRFNVYEMVKKVTVNGAPIIDIDHECKAGIVHVVDKVIFPLPDGDLVETLKKLSKFSVFAQLIKQAEMEQELKNIDGLTLFAPINEAFDDLSRDYIQELNADKSALQNLLRYHVIQGTRYSAGLVDRQRIQAKSRSMMQINKDKNGAISLNMPVQARVLYADLPADNGVIHVIDKILIPPKGQYILQF